MLGVSAGKCGLTVIDPLPSLPAVPVEETDAQDDHAELIQLLLLVLPKKRHEGAHLRLREHTLQGSFRRRKCQSEKQEVTELHLVKQFKNYGSKLKVMFFRSLGQS